MNRYFHYSGFFIPFVSIEYIIYYVAELEYEFPITLYILMYLYFIEMRIMLMATLNLIQSHILSCKFSACFLKNIFFVSSGSVNSVIYVNKLVYLCESFEICNSSNPLKPWQNPVNRFVGYVGVGSLMGNTLWFPFALIHHHRRRIVSVTVKDFGNILIIYCSWNILEVIHVTH